MGRFGGLFIIFVEDKIVIWLISSALTDRIIYVLFYWDLLEYYEE